MEETQEPKFQEPGATTVEREGNKLEIAEQTPPEQAQANDQNKGSVSDPAGQIDATRDIAHSVVERFVAKEVSIAMAQGPNLHDRVEALEAKFETWEKRMATHGIQLFTD